MNGQFAVLHYNSDGTQDTSFGGAQRHRHGEFRRHQRNALGDGAGLQRLDPRGGTSTQTGTGKDFALARFNADGTLDTFYGMGGTITTDFGGDDVATAMAIQPADGKILVAGYSDQNGSTSFALARYDDSDLGGLGIDKSFGTDGKVTTYFGDGDDLATGVAVQGDGKIVVSGSTLLDSSANVDSQPHFALARYKTNGTPDTSFGAGTAPRPGRSRPISARWVSQPNRLRGCSWTPTGRLIVAGTAAQPDFSSFAVSCYDPGTSSLGRPDQRRSAGAPVVRQPGGRYGASARPVPPRPVHARAGDDGDFQLSDRLG